MSIPKSVMEIIFYKVHEENNFSGSKPTITTPI